MSFMVGVGAVQVHEGHTRAVGDRLSADRGVARKPDGPRELVREKSVGDLLRPHSLGEPRIAAGIETGRAPADRGLSDASRAEGEAGASGA